MDSILWSCNNITAITYVSKINFEQLEKLLQNRFKNAYVKLHYINLIQSLENCDLLIDHFQVQINEEIKRIFIILGILYADKMTQTYIHKLQSTDLSVVANILEIIENQYPDKIKQVLMPIIDETSMEEKLHSGAGFLGSIIQSVNDVIIDLTESEELWKSALAIHTIINNQLESLICKIDWERSLKNPFIKELISKELNLKDSMFKNTFQPFIKTSEIREDFVMFTTLDKTIILKGVNLFSGLTGEEVFQIAQIAVEEQYLVEEIIFSEGDVGDSMFIIINGSVSVYNQKKVITTLEKGECFGEMALLDREPRSSSIRAVTDTVVLRIDEESFYELVAGNIEIIQGIVKILSQRLRHSNA